MNTTLRAYLDELNLLLEQEALEEVIGHCRHILQHFPKNVETYRLLGRALLEKGRLLILRVALPDIPGSLGRLTGLLGQTGANILHLFHDRLARELPLDYTRVELNLETRGPEHGKAVLKALKEAGYEVEEKV